MRVVEDELGLDAVEITVGGASAEQNRHQYRRPAPAAPKRLSRARARTRWNGRFFSDAHERDTRRRRLRPGRVPDPADKGFGAS
jgi:hypothetical protein